MSESIFDRMGKAINKATEANNTIQDDILPSIEKSFANMKCAIERLKREAQEMIAKREKE